MSDVASLITAARVRMTMHLGEIAGNAAPLHAHARDLRRNPDDAMVMGWAREELTASRNRLAEIIASIDAAVAAIDAESAPAPVQVGDAAAKAVMDGVEAGGGVRRLVPRMPIVKTEGAMGVVSPSGPEAA